MAEYRTGTHHGVTICRENDGFRCDRDGHDCTRGHLVAVVVNGDTALAERICALLNGDQPTDWVAFAQQQVADMQAEVAADSCTCIKAGPDPACPVHQGRRARGPKPPPLGPGCICDGSGRTCPRHGAVI